MTKLYGQCLIVQPDWKSILNDDESLLLYHIDRVSPNSEPKKEGERERERKTSNQLNTEHKK